MTAAVTAAASDVRDKLQDFLREKWKNVSLTMTEVGVLLPQLENMTRAEFTLDLNTDKHIAVII